MSWDCTLIDPVTKEPLTVDFKHHIIGGTYAIGGTNKLTLNITYNYAQFLKVREKYLLQDILPAMSGAESIPIIKGLIGILKDDIDHDYWKATEGNAKQALCGLLALAQLRPDGVWKIS